MFRSQACEISKTGFPCVRFRAQTGYWTFDASEQWKQILSSSAHPIYDFPAPAKHLRAARLNRARGKWPNATNHKNYQRFDLY